MKSNCFSALFIALTLILSKSTNGQLFNVSEEVGVSGRSMGILHNLIGGIAGTGERVLGAIAGNGQAIQNTQSKNQAKNVGIVYLQICC